MTARRVIIAVGVALLLAGVIGLLVPVSVSDGNGSVGCGNGLASDLSAAKSANERNGANIAIFNQGFPHIDFVTQCESSLSTRRSWSIPLTLVGVVAISGALLVRRSEAAGV